MAGYVLSLALVFLRPRRPAFLIRLTLFLIFLTTLVIYPFPPRKVAGLTLTFLDVGDGRAILIELPGREKILMDGGGFHRSPFDTGEHIVSPLLWRYGVKRLRSLIASHGHRDHYGGLLSVLENFRVDSVYYGGIPPPEGGYAVLLKKVADQGIPVIYPSDGEKIPSGKTDILFLTPGRRTPPLRDENNGSLVLYIRYQNRGALLPSDLEMPGEKRLIGAAEVDSVSLLEAPHHGRKTSSTAPFIRRFKPQVVVISGDGRTEGEEITETAAKYERMGARVFRTDRHGAVTVAFDKAGLFVFSANPDFSPAVVAKQR